MCSNEKDPFGWGDFDREETNSDGQHFWGSDNGDGTTTWFDDNGYCDCITETPDDDCAEIPCNHNDCTGFLRPCSAMAQFCIA